MTFDYYLRVARAGDVYDYLWPYWGTWKTLAWRRLIAYRKAGMAFEAALRLTFVQMKQNTRVWL